VDIDGLAADQFAQVAGRLVAWTERTLHKGRLTVTDPFRKPRPADPVWLTEKIWEEIEKTRTDAFLAAFASQLRLERWGNTLRALVAPVPSMPADPARISPPPGFPWKAERIIWQVEGGSTAVHLLGSGWETSVRELGLTYGIDLTPGIAPGLFPDQRENRVTLRSLRPKSVLNLFAHTCAFGALAASEGATTLNIDSSARALARGKENYARNRLEGPAHRFWTEDVRKVLPRLIRRGEKFDAVILDPPTFAHGSKGRAFRITHELEPILISCLPLTSRRGTIFVSINDSQTGPAQLSATIRNILAREQVQARIEPGKRPPEVPPDRMPATLWIFRED